MICDVRRPSVADELREARREELAALTPAERVALALRLGSQSLASFCAKSGLSREVALAAREIRMQARRRRSGCLEALHR